MRPAAACLCAALLATPAAGQTGISPEWTAEKCRRYSRAWDHATAGGVLGQLTPAFIADHDRFLAGGCRTRGRVCPVTPAERKLADMLSLMAVAEGMAGSFLPFTCAAAP